MSKIGVKLSIDVTKLDKKLFFQGKKGIYADLIAFIDLEDVNSAGNHGVVSQDVSQEQRERQGKDDMPILGGVKIFWRDDNIEDSMNDNVPVKDKIPF